MRGDKVHGGYGISARWFMGYICSSSRIHLARWLWDICMVIVRYLHGGLWDISALLVGYILHGGYGISAW